MEMRFDGPIHFLHSICADVQVLFFHFDTVGVSVRRCQRGFLDMPPLVLSLYLCWEMFNMKR